MEIWLAGQMPREKLNLLPDCERDTVKILDGDGGVKIPEAVTLTQRDVGFQMEG